jgi:hypothetical protein
MAVNQDTNLMVAQHERVNLIERDGKRCNLANTGQPGALPPSSTPDTKTAPIEIGAALIRH